MPPRRDSRAADALRPLRFELDPQRHAAGSVLVKWGDTHVLCAVSVEDKVPPHRLASGGGWVSAEYAMLPASTSPRAKRERPSPSGRSAEIQRLIGRSLRAVVDIDRIGARTLWVDCDVVQADGGTRCASITGAWIALARAMRRIGLPLPEPVAAVSVGIIDGEVRVDLEYEEDSRAHVDLNYVATPRGLVEVQGTGEGRPFSRGQLDEMLALADVATRELFERQRALLATP